MNENNPTTNSNPATSSMDAKIIMTEETGVPAEFTSEEAERMGGFTEDALSEAEAMESNKVRG